MKNLLILIVAIALFLHFFPQPEVTEFYEQQKESFLEGFSDATDTKVKLRPQKIYEELRPKFNSFRESELKNLKQITSSRKEVKAFYQTHCLSKKRSPSFHVRNQHTICQTMSKYANLF